MWKEFVEKVGFYNLDNKILDNKINNSYNNTL